MSDNSRTLMEPSLSKGERYWSVQLERMEAWSSRDFSWTFRLAYHCGCSPAPAPAPTPIPSAAAAAVTESWVPFLTFDLDLLISSPSFPLFIFLEESGTSEFPSGGAMLALLIRRISKWRTNLAMAMRYSIIY